MPNKLDKVKLPTGYDRRVKLSLEQKELIREEYKVGDTSYNKLAIKYGVSKKTILLICNAESKAKNDKRIKEHWKDYYCRDAHNKAVKNLRHYKVALHGKGVM